MSKPEDYYRNSAEDLEKRLKEDNSESIGRQTVIDVLYGLSQVLPKNTDDNELIDLAERIASHEKIIAMSEENDELGKHLKSQLELLKGMLNLVEQTRKKTEEI